MYDESSLRYKAGEITLFNKNFFKENIKSNMPFY